MRDARTPPRTKGGAAVQGKSGSAERGLAAAQKVARHSAQEVRIIGGQWKRTPLTVPVAAGLRPTPSRVRETLFNWLGQDLSGWVVLDAFAGSGALGLEAASRGAQAVTLIERDGDLAQAIRASIHKLKADAQVSLQLGDAVPWMRQAGQQGKRFDLVFLDPPFENQLFESALEAACLCVPIGGWIYLEAPQSFESWGTGLGGQEATKLRLARHGKAGAVHFHLFQRVDEGSPSADI